ncbi:shikimate kinase [Brevibacillus sp. MCWH]|jgi:shikimate kinase|uniref:shikimate kinase n=1 Tax=Brevibacillus sp. MCWH TaxID=2508871 RepID=UPI000E3AFE64|nr:shikimate kinase [Brevibacillus sp. MCWH]NNV02786.1 shikimate kinase [Brevibacillus sp. MCWH]REK62390.1 MAG: shikimate kinase [Brevibacillus sp.]
MTYGNVIFVGFMGTGKTTVGSALAKDLGIPHRDLDEAIAEREGCSIPELFATKGEQYFRDAESAMLRELLQEKPQVLTTGGGAVLRPENVRLMLSEGTVIALSAAEEELIRRLAGDTGRPLIAGDVAQRVRRLLDERKGAYDFAPIQIDTTGKDVSDIVAEIRGRMVESGLIGRD